MENVLIHRAYIGGTLYYKTPETFLFFLARLMRDAAEVRQRLGQIFSARISELFGTKSDALALAMRIIAAASMALTHKPDVHHLLSMQQLDGSWTEGWFYKYGSSGLLIGNDGVTTALALQALEAVSDLESEVP